MECYLVLKLLLPAAVVFIAMSKATAQEQSGTLQKYLMFDGFFVTCCRGVHSAFVLQ